MTISHENAQAIAEALIDSTEAITQPESRAALGTAITHVFCRAMLTLFPEPNAEGLNVLQVIGERIKEYPVPVMSPVEKSQTN
jgi:hypothetical protein